MHERLEQLVARLIDLSTPDESGSRKLPPERDLGIALDMSRGALREQLAMLENIGVLRRRQGHGTYIDAPDASFIRTYFTLMLQLDYFGNEQFEQARVMLEETVAEAAASHVTDADVAELRKLVERMIERTTAGDADGALEADLTFHNRLYDIVDNPIFNMLNLGFSHVLRENIQRRRDLAVSIEKPDADGSINTDAVHYAIVDALESHDPQAARAAMHKHFVDFRRLAQQAETTGETV